MSFWLNEQRLLTHVRWLPTSTRIGFLAGSIGLIGCVWLFGLFLPQRKFIKIDNTKQQMLQQNISMLSSQLMRYQKLASLSSEQNEGKAAAQDIQPIRWVDTFEHIVMLLSAEKLACKKITMLKDNLITGINGKTVEYVFTGRYAYVVNFLEKIQHQFSHLQIIQLQVDRKENHEVSVLLKLCLLDG